MRAEILALWGLLWFTSQICIDELWVFGDSKVVIDHLNRGNKLSSRHPIIWLEHIDSLRKSFSIIHFNHIFRENNSQVDRLSKKGLVGDFRQMF